MTDPCVCCSALWIKFQLTTTLSPTSTTASAVVYANGGTRQYWQGDDPDPLNNGVPVYNLEMHQPAGPTPTYQFSGVVGDVGMACLDDSDPETLKYRIVQLGKAGVLLGQWWGSSTGGATGHDIWQYGEANPVEIYGGPAPGGETDQGFWLNVQNWLGPVAPATWVMIGNNGFGWYLLSPVDDLILGKYTSSSGNPSYWQPGAKQTVEVYIGTPFTEFDGSISIPNVANRWGPVALGFVWLGWGRQDNAWYVVAPQGHALLCKFIGSEVWKVRTTNAAGSLTVYGGAAVGGETDTGWILNGVYNYHGDIQAGADVRVWVNTNGYTSDSNYTLNWYVVDAPPNSPFLAQYIDDSTPVLDWRTASGVNQFEIYDDQGNDIGKTIPTAVRAFATVFLGDLCMIFYDSNNSELYAIPLGRPFIGKVTGSTIPQGDTGTVAVYDSDGNIVDGVSPTVSASCLPLILDQWCLCWWDYRQQQFYGAPLSAPRTIWGTLAGALSAGGSVDCTVATVANGPLPSGTITVYDKYGILTGTSGDLFCAVEDVPNQTWYFLTVQC